MTTQDPSLTGVSRKNFVRHSNVDQWHFTTEVEFERPEKWASIFRATSQNTYSRPLRQPDEAAVYLATLLLPAKVGLHGKAADWFFLTSTQSNPAPKIEQNLDTALHWSERLLDRKLFYFIEIMRDCDFVQDGDNSYYARYTDIEDGSQQWVEELYKYPENKKWTTSDIRPILKKVDDLLNGTKFVELDRMFRILDTTRMPPIIMISLLRAAYAYRSGIPNWFSFCIQVRDELIKRKLNAESLLQGLLDEDELPAK